MENYRFQDVLCPFCKKSYMTRIYDDYDLIVEFNGNVLNGWYDRCPKCNEDVFVVENDNEGKDLSQYPKESITVHFILR